MSDFIRYLLAKRTVDDRALNRYVWQMLAKQVGRQPQPLRVLEVGAGVGTMVERLVSWGLLTSGSYTAVDADPTCMTSARQRLGSRHKDLDLTWETADLFHFAAQAPRQKWDLLIAHALLDLVDLQQALPALMRLLRPGGLFYFTLNFDGETIFQPALEEDAAVISAYHRTMDGRPGGSQTGRRLFHQVQLAGGRVLAMGSSDWVVHPVAQEVHLLPEVQPLVTGKYVSERYYPADEAFFLHFILDTIAGALTDRPELNDGQRQSWLQQRRAQIEAGQLVYIAHQLDLVGSYG
jgi:SAM-dependent methyltransferase